MPCVSDKPAFEGTNLLVLDRSFPLGNDQTIVFKLLFLQGFLRVDHLVRLGRVLDDPGTRLRRQLLGRFGEGHSQIAPVISYSLLVCLKPDESPFSQLGRPGQLLSAGNHLASRNLARDKPDRPALARGPFANKWKERCF